MIRFYKIELLLIILIVQLGTTINGQNNNIKRMSEDKPFILGTMSSIQSKVLSETRNLNIYLPDGYSPDSGTTYPVIYVLDGSARGYFTYVVGIVQFFTHTWTNRLPKSIVVGIENVDRNRDFTFFTNRSDFYSEAGFTKKDFPVIGGSEKFILFIEKELQPFIEKNYKTNSSKTIIGASFGGLLATEILLKKPNLFNTYFILSPSLWWDKESLLQKAPALLKKQPKNKIQVYVGVSNEWKNMIKEAGELTDLLRKNGGDHIQAVYDYLPNENHITMIHQSVYNAIKLLYPEK